MARPNARCEGRLGVIVSKKVAKQAVRRNYMKRVLRELFRTLPDGTPGFDLVIRVKKPFDHHHYAAVQQQWTPALLRVARKCRDCS